MVVRLYPKVLRRNMSAVAAALWRIPNARLSIPAAIGVCESTVEKWLTGATEPKASNLIALMRSFDEVADEVLRQADRQDGGLTFEQRSKLLQILGEK